MSIQQNGKINVELAQTFNNRYNAVKINSGFKHSKVTNQLKNYFSVIDEIIRTYKDHTIVSQISSAITTSSIPKPIFSCFEPTNPVEVQKRLKSINTKKATDFSKIPPK